MLFEFPAIKLLDFEPRRDELERSENIFAPVVLAHLDALATAQDSTARFDRKLALWRRLLGSGHDKGAVRRLLVFLDVLLKLPRPADNLWWENWRAVTGEKAMPLLGGEERFQKEVLPELMAMAARFETRAKVLAETFDERTAVYDTATAARLRELAEARGPEALLKACHLAFTQRPAAEIEAALLALPEQRRISSLETVLSWRDPQYWQ